MSEFLKFAFELIGQIVYYVTDWVVGIFSGFVKIFITGWVNYILIFKSYFPEFNLFVKILAILLCLILIAIPCIIFAILIRRAILYIRLKGNEEDNVELYKEIGRLNRQVLNLMDEKNKILALKVGGNGPTSANGRVSYVGADALLDTGVPTVGNVVGVGVGGGTAAAGGTINLGGDGEGSGNITLNVNGGVEGVGGGGGSFSEDALATAASAAATASAQAKKDAEEKERNTTIRFPKLDLVDRKYAFYEYPEFDNEITLQQLAERYRLYACSNHRLYYTPEIVRRFIAGMASSHLLILEGISGTGKTSLPYSFSRFLNNPATIVSVQPSYRDRTEIVGYFNEFSKRFNETEFLRALYEANYRKDPCIVVLDEVNLARIEYYFAEMLSVLEMPSVDEWTIDLVPTAWASDPARMEGGKIHVTPNTWFVGTANNDDSTFTITDKVYDRAMPIELNERAAEFTCEFTPSVDLEYNHLVEMFAKAKEEYPVSEAMMDKLGKLDIYLQTRFKLAVGNRIIKQMNDFIPVYVACGGTEAGAMDYILARKVLKKFESLNVSFVRDEIKGLIAYIEKIFGKTSMPDSRAFLTRIQNFY